MLTFLRNRIAYAADDGSGSAAPADKADAPVVVDEPKGGEEAETLLGKADFSAKADGDSETEKKPDAEEEEKKLTPEEELAQSVPEDGKYEFTLPDGMQIDEELASEASPVLKEIGVNRGNANKLAEFIANREKAKVERWSKTQEEWMKSAREDKEYGGDKFDASLGVAVRSLEKFGTPELRTALEHSGMGNHPEMIRFMARVGNAFSDDKPVGTEEPAAGEKSQAEILYGATTPKTRGK